MGREGMHVHAASQHASEINLETYAIKATRLQERFKHNSCAKRGLKSKRRRTVRARQTGSSNSDIVKWRRADLTLIA
jgi:hypothetical protein